MRFKSRNFIVILLTLFSREWALAEGFDANSVKVERTLAGVYRVTFRYSHLEIGEYRESFAEFKTEKEAISLFDKIKNGSDFRLGNYQSLPKPTGINQNQKPF